MLLVITPRWLIVACLAPWPAAGSVCEPGAVRGAFLAEWTRIETSAFESPALGAVQLTASSLRARLWRRAKKHASESGWRTLRLVHDYRAYDIPSTDSPLETNGHLHHLGLEYRVEHGAWEWAVSPLLAASSNAGRHPRVIDRDTVAWHGFARRTHRLSESVGAFWGVCRDDRLGRRRVVPVVGVDWHIERFELAIGYPESALTWHAHPRWAVQARVHPSGGSWRVFSDDLTRRSRFGQAGWRYGVGLTFGATAKHRLTAIVGRDVRRSFRFRLEDGRNVRAEASAAWLLGVRLQWVG
ncbi:MAG: hypothetical protein OXK76_19475 [Gammaproteobacteria bacterium]|nr:hypothetical protein [Gammaproteobacteria bacterium]